MAAAWKSDTADGRYLQSLLETNMITNMTPKEVQMSHARFLKYNNNSFASTLRRLRKKLSDRAAQATNQASKYLVDCCFVVYCLFFVDC